jgi:hypothetical protein
MHVLLAMQKVEGSNPFSRFEKRTYLQAFFCVRSRLVRLRRAGLTPDSPRGGVRREASGLQGLEDRLATLDGRLHIESPADGGTLVAEPSQSLKALSGAGPLRLHAKGVCHNCETTLAARVGNR